MKKQLTLFILWLSMSIMAQTGGFNYKALIAENGNALNTQAVTLKFTVLQNGTTNVYQETHTTTTDPNGIVSVQVGEGNMLSGDFATIDWGADAYFLKVEIDTGSGFVDFGTTEFKAVPYAKFADKAGNVFSGNFSDLNGIPAGLSDGDDDTHLTDAQIAAMGYIKNPNDADHDATNELQTISKDASNVVTLSNGGGSFTDADTHLSEAQVDTYVANNGYLTGEVDGSITNEIQSLTLNTNELSISDGNTVTFTDWDTDSSDDVHSMDDLSDAKATNFSIYAGLGSGSHLTSGAHNTSFGQSSLQNLTSGSFNTAVGKSALFDLTTGRENTVVGANAMSTANFSYNTVVGFGAGQNATGNSNVFIGRNAGKNTGGSNLLFIDNSDTNNPLIFGDFFTDEITVNGTLKVTGGNPGVGKVFTSDANGKGSWEEPANQTDADFYTLGTTEASTDINDHIYHLGRLLLGSDSSGNFPYGNLEITPKSDEYVIRSKRISSFNSGLIGDIRFETQYEGDYNFMEYYARINGSGTGRVNGMVLNISVNNDAVQIGVDNYLQSSGAGLRIGVKNRMAISSGEIKGVFNEITSPRDGIHYGTHNLLSGAGDGKQMGVQNQMFATGNGELIGVENIIDNLNTGATAEQMGVRNVVYSHADNKQYGVYNALITGGSADKIATFNSLIGYGSGSHYGTYNVLEKLNSDPGSQFGSFNHIKGPGIGEKFGVYSKIEASAGGHHTAIYAEATKAGSQAGVFVGDVVISGQTEIDGKLITMVGGNADMKAYVYGRIYSNGSISTGASSSGFTVTKLSDFNGHYQVTLTTPAAQSYSYLVNASIDFAASDTVESATVFVQRISSSVFEIFTYKNSDNSHHNYPVSFVVYKK